MIDEYTYTLLKRLLEFPCSWDNTKVEFGRFQQKYILEYGGNLKSLGQILTRHGRLGLIKIESPDIFIVENTYQAVAEYENWMAANERKSNIEFENLIMQNQLLQRQLHSKEAEIQKLTITNLKLQNRSFRLQWIMLVIGLIAGFVTSNFGFFQKLFGSP